MIRSASTDSSPDDRRLIRLCVQGLHRDDSDLARIAAFLRIGRERLRCDWQMVSGGDIHVLLWAQDEPRNAAAGPREPWATLRLVDAGSAHRDGPDTLQRPLQYDDFIAALTGLETRLAATVATAAPFPQGASYRLRRWPPLALLRTHRHYPRLASFLSKRPIALEDLATLSNAGRGLCEGFLSALAAAGLLEVAAAASAGAPLDGGAFARIRRTLGLPSWR